LWCFEGAPSNVCDVLRVLQAMFVMFWGCSKQSLRQFDILPLPYYFIFCLVLDSDLLRY
jgi:hypothetical protein